MFKRNEGIIDRVVRVALAVALLPAGLLWLGLLQGGVLAVLVAGLGVVMLVTGLTGFCPSYVLFGINTLEKEKELMAKCASMAAGCAPEGHPVAGQACSCAPRRPAAEQTQNQQA